MFVEDTVPAADGHLAITLGIKRESNPWCWIEEMAFQTASVGGGSNANGGEIRPRHERKCSSLSSALHEAVQRIGSVPGVLLERAIIEIEYGRVGWVESGRVKVEGLPVALAISSIQADAQAKIQGETFVDAPVVLEVRLHDSVPVVVLLFCGPLLVARDVSQQEIGEGVARCDIRVAGVKGQNALDVGRVGLVLLRKYDVCAELHGVSAADLSHVVAISVSGVGVMPRKVAAILPEAAAIGRVAT